VGTVVGTLVASDLDGDPFVYSMALPFPDSPFVVEADGRVVLVGPLDYEFTVSYSLAVFVNETGSSRNCQLSSSTTVRGFMPMVLVPTR
jgi:hypothetical protein